MCALGGIVSLRLKVIVILLAVFGLYATLVYGIQNLAIMPSFRALESDEASKNLDRALRAIEREIELLSPSVSDWAHWDDTYQFATDRNADYVEANLAASTLEGLHVNVMNFYDRAGNLIWGRAQELDSGTEIRLGDLSASRLPPDHMLLRHSDVGSAVSGIFMSKRGPLLTVSKPILKTDGAGPINGTVVLGRFLDSQAVERLAKQAQVDLRVSLNPGEGSTAHWQQKNGGLRHTGAEIEERGTVSRAHTIVADLAGQAALLLQVDTPRDITARGRTAVRFSLISIFGAGVLVLLVLLGLLQRTVVAPVARLTHQASDIGERGDLTARVSVHRKDEVGILAREFDRMVDRLAATRRKLLEQSYRALRTDSGRWPPAR